MNSLPQSVSMPSREKGSRSSTTFKPSITSLALFRSIGIHSSQHVEISTNTSVFRKAPLVLPPQCATRSISIKPGITSSQSAKVLTYMWCFSKLPRRVVLTPVLIRSRSGLSKRSAVAALIESNRWRTSASNLR